MHKSKRFLAAVVFGLFVASACAQSGGVRFSVAGGIKKDTFVLELFTEAPNRVICYTTDGTIPSLESTVYTEAITIDKTTLISAVAGYNDTLDSIISRAGYIFADDNIYNFSSNLPVLVISNFGQGTIPKVASASTSTTIVDDKQFTVSSLIEPTGGRTDFTVAPSLEYNSGIKIRGTSSAQFPKKSYAYESWDNDGNETDIKPLGMAKCADWILHGSRKQDPTYIRSIVPFAISNRMGQWAPASVAVELFIHTGSGNLSISDHQGIYFFMENIGRGKDKLDIKKCKAEDTGYISGGYILNVDRIYDIQFFECMHSEAGGVTNYIYPKPDNMSSGQKEWIQDYIDTLEEKFALIPESREYTDYIDVNAAIDHWWLKTMALDVDAFVLSEFFYKDMNGKIKMGPIWDLDRSAGSLDERTEAWNTWSGDALADYWNIGWYEYLHQDPEYKQALYDRWSELRQNQLQIDTVIHIIDSLADVMHEAMTRDIELWEIVTNYGSFEGEIEHLKDWYTNRIYWIDSKINNAPVFLEDTILLTGTSFDFYPNIDITIENASDVNGTLYYTTDGTDPRLEGGEIANTAVSIDSAITVENTTHLSARIYFDDGTWSSLRAADFYCQQDYSKLIISEIYYHPADIDSLGISDELEFIELENTGEKALYMSGVYFSNGIEFKFPSDAILQSKEHFILSSNTEKFNYYNNATPDYEYSKQLSDKGEKIKLSAPDGETITEVEYNDKAPWPSLADGSGFSLVYVSGEQNNAANWRLSSQAGGSPGSVDSLYHYDTVLINEILVEDKIISIELYNPTDSAISVGGWLLSTYARADSVWQIPGNPEIEARGFLVFDNNDFGNNLNLSSSGDEIYLFAVADSSISGYSHGMKLGVCIPGISYGFYTNSIGDIHTVPYASTTPGEENSLPRTGPVIIKDIFYNPPEIAGNNSIGEYIILKNCSDSSINLYDTLNAENTWKVKGIDFSFPQYSQILPGEQIYLIEESVSTADFRACYSLDSSVQIYRFDGSLSNKGESIQLQMPLAPVTTAGEEYVPFATIDKVKYTNISPWPDADGNMMKLSRIDEHAYGNDPANWTASDACDSLMQFVKLTLVNGTGPETVVPGTEVSITAANPPAGQCFYRWQTDSIQYLSAPYLAVSQLTMPYYDITVTAEFIGVEESMSINWGDEWQYDNSATDLSTLLFESGYDDWQQGNTPIGAGYTVATEIDLGEDSTKAHTVYFQKQVSLRNIPNITNAIAGLQYDDGLIFYINGKEALRLGFDEDSEVLFNTYATSHSADIKEYYRIDAGLFVSGENIIQVEVHNKSASSSDMYFDMELMLEYVEYPDSVGEQTISLIQGWNLVSLALEPHKQAVASLFPNATTVKTVDSYFDKTVPSYLNSLQYLHRGDAVFVYNSTDEERTIYGTNIYSDYSYSLSEGWNLIGVPLNNISSYPIPENDAIVLIKNFEDFWDADSFSTIQYFEPGKGYWIFIDEEMTLLFSQK